MKESSPENKKNFLGKAAAVLTAAGIVTAGLQDRFSESTGKTEPKIEWKVSQNNIAEALLPGHLASAVHLCKQAQNNLSSESYKTFLQSIENIKIVSGKEPKPGEDTLYDALKADADKMKELLNK